MIYVTAKSRTNAHFARCFADQANEADSFGIGCDSASSLSEILKKRTVQLEKVIAGLKAAQLSSEPFFRPEAKPPEKAPAKK